MQKPFKALAAALLVLACALAAAAPQQPVLLLPLSGAIGPAGADFVLRGMARAEKENAQLVVLQIDTPGGLDTSMRQIIKAILASNIPVAAYVAPGGARAASAGTYILYASHVAAMAPGTNLGAATPVQIGVGDPGGPGAEKKAEKPNAMEKKQVHDAAAYIRGLAQLRGRNADWAERAVREAVSLSASEAQQQKVIDLVAVDAADLLAQLNGRKLATAGGERTLNTAGAPLQRIDPDWRTTLLATITDPGIALILMMIGIYGLMFEFYNPGMVLPGVAGAICLLIGLFALQMLPINYAGLALIALGIAFMVAEAALGTFGVLGIGGVIAFAAGAVMLIDTELPAFGVPLPLIVTLALGTALFAFFAAGLALRAQRRPLSSGAEFAGGSGVMLEDADGEGWAQVHGERWRVRAPVPLKRGQRVTVTARDGLLLTVRPAPDQPGE